MFFKIQHLPYYEDMKSLRITLRLWASIFEKMFCKNQTVMITVLNSIVAILQCSYSMELSQPSEIQMEGQHWI